METAAAQRAHIDIEWDRCDARAWRGMLDAIAKSNLLQSPAYARAMRHARQQATRFGLVRAGGQAAGIVQVQEIRLFGLLHFVFLDRGPLFLPAFDTPDNMLGFYRAFAREFPRRPGRRRRVMPEMPLCPQTRAALEGMGYVYAARGYRSSFVDLAPARDALRAALKPKWRSALNGAEKAGLEVEEDPAGRHLSWLVAVHMRDRAEKKYAGASPALLRRLFTECAKEKGVLFLRALKDGEPVAAALFFLHGRAATYQVGWAAEAGRRAGAMNLLLFTAMLRLKARGIAWLDTGGMNDETAGGVTRFKKGLGGEPYELCGIYR